MINSLDKHYICANTILAHMSSPTNINQELDKKFKEFICKRKGIACQNPEEARKAEEANRQAEEASRKVEEAKIAEDNARKEREKQFADESARVTKQLMDNANKIEELKSQLKQSTIANQSLSNEINDKTLITSNIQLKNTALIEEINKLKDNNTNLLHEKNINANLISENNSKIAELQANLDKNQSNLSTKTNELDKISKEFDKQKLDFITQTERLNQLNDEYQRMQDKLTKQTEQMKNEKINYEKQIEELKKSVNSNDEMKKKLDQVTQDNAILQKNQKENNDILSQIEAQQAQLKIIKDKANTQKILHEKVKTELESINKNLLDENGKLRDQIKSIEESNNEQLKQIAELKNQNKLNANEMINLQAQLLLQQSTFDNTKLRLTDQLDELKRKCEDDNTTCKYNKYYDDFKCNIHKIILELNLRSKDTDLQSKVNNITNQNIIISQNEAVIATKEAEIANNNNEIIKLKNAQTQCDNSLYKSFNDHAKLIIEIKSKDEIITHQKSEISSKDAQIQQLAGNQNNLYEQFNDRAKLIIALKRATATNDWYKYFQDNARMQIKQMHQSHICSNSHYDEFNAKVLTTIYKQQAIQLQQAIQQPVQQHNYYNEFNTNAINAILNYYISHTSQSPELNNALSQLFRKNSLQIIQSLSSSPQYDKFIEQAKDVLISYYIDYLRKQIQALPITTPTTTTPTTTTPTTTTPTTTNPIVANQGSEDKVSAF